MVFEEQLKSGLPKGASTLLSSMHWLKTATSSTIIAFQRRDPWRVGLCEINFECKARKVIGETALLMAFQIGRF